MNEENRLFGRYLISKFLGSGATSEVYLARDTKLDRQVALKILKPTLVSDQTSFERFTREAQAASKLFHDHIATVLDMGETEGRYYIAMRYVEGISLEQYLQKNGPLEWEQVKKLAAQIGSAISHAHQQQYLHRDIKPNNIMVSSKGDFVLTDFGLTRAMQESGLTSTIGAVMGTPPYIPPEIWNGRQANPSSDQYSFACVIDEVITGRVLFAGDTAQEIITKHLVNKPDISSYPPEVPENVKYVVQKALSKEGKDRFADVDAFVLALESPKEFNVQAYLSQLDEKNRSQADREKLEKLKKKKKSKGCVITVLILTLLLLLTCGIGYVFFRDRIPQNVRELIGMDPVETAVETAPPVSAPNQGTAIAPQPIPEDTNSPTSAPTNTESFTASNTPTLAPSPTWTPTSTSTPTQIPQAGDEEQVPVGSGAVVTMEDSIVTELVVSFFRGDDTPISGVYVMLYTQKQDLSGNWVTDERIDYSNTDNAGSVRFTPSPGQYIISADFNGYSWGNGTDVNGLTSVSIENGKTTQLVVRLARIRIGFVYADGSVVDGGYVKIFTQRQNIAGEWVTDDRSDYGNTDNSGEVIFDLPAGNYIVSSDFSGYNWGDAIDVMGEANIPLRPGEVTSLIIHLGQMVVALKDVDGNPIINGYVKVYYQGKDVNGNPARGNSITYGQTGNTGTITFNLTPGTYAFEYDSKTYYNIELQAGKITTTDGKNTIIED